MDKAVENINKNRISTKGKQIKKDDIETIKKVIKDRSKETQKAIVDNEKKAKKKKAVRKKDAEDKRKQIKKDYEDRQKKLNSPKYKAEQSNLDKKLGKARKELNKKQKSDAKKAQQAYDALSDSEKLSIKIKEFNKAFDVFNVSNFSSGDMALVVKALGLIPSYTKKAYGDLVKNEMDKTRLSSKFAKGFIKGDKDIEPKFRKYLGELLVGILQKMSDTALSGGMTPKIRQTLTDMASGASGKEKFSFKKMAGFQKMMERSDVLSMSTRATGFPKVNQLQYTLMLGKLLREDQQKFSPIQKSQVKGFIEDLADPTKSKPKTVEGIKTFTKQEGLFGMLRKGPISEKEKFPKEMLPFLFGFENAKEMKKASGELQKSPGLIKSKDSQEAMFGNMLKYASNIFSGTQIGKAKADVIGKSAGVNVLRPRVEKSLEMMREISEKLDSLEEDVEKSNNEVIVMADKLDTKIIEELGKMSKIIEDIDGDLAI